MTSWEKDLQDTLAGSTVAAVINTPAFDAEAVRQLREAGMRFSTRAKQDDFAVRSAEACHDIAKRVERDGRFASEKQKEYAMKLIGWSLPRAATTPVTTVKAVGPLEVPKLFTVLQKHTHFHAEPLKLSRKNQDTLCWIMFDGQCVGKIEDARVSLFTRRLGSNEPKVVALLKEFEQNPLEAAKKYGKLSGRCCSCGRDLTDPESIERGIGPVCMERF